MSKGTGAAQRFIAQRGRRTGVGEGGRGGDNIPNMPPSPPIMSPSSTLPHAQRYRHFLPTTHPLPSYLGGCNHGAEHTPQLQHLLLQGRGACAAKECAGTAQDMQMASVNRSWTTLCCSRHAGCLRCPVPLHKTAATPTPCSPCMQAGAPALTRITRPQHAAPCLLPD